MSWGNKAAGFLNEHHNCGKIMAGYFYPIAYKQLSTKNLTFLKIPFIDKDMKKGVFSVYT